MVVKENLHDVLNGISDEDLSFVQDLLDLSPDQGLSVEITNDSIIVREVVCIEEMDKIKNLCEKWKAVMTPCADNKCVIVKTNIVLEQAASDIKEDMSTLTPNTKYKRKLASKKIGTKIAIAVGVGLLATTIYKLLK